MNRETITNNAIDNAPWGVSGLFRLAVMGQANTLHGVFLWIIR
jgi:hypothetical protein